MKLSELNIIFERANRINCRFEIKSGIGTNWSCTFEDGETQEYELNGVKPPEEIQDDMDSIFVWLWSLKDYIKKYSIANGHSKEWVENKVNKSSVLCVCADIANSKKHGGYDRGSRSNQFPVLGNLCYQFPQQANRKLTFFADKVVADIHDPNLITLKMNILDKSGNIIGDAFEYLKKAIDAWDEIIVEAGPNA